MKLHNQRISQSFEKFLKSFGWLLQRNIARFVNDVSTVPHLSTVSLVFHSARAAVSRANPSLPRSVQDHEILNVSRWFCLPCLSVNFYFMCKTWYNPSLHELVIFGQWVYYDFSTIPLKRKARLYIFFVCHRWAEHAAGALCGSLGNTCAVGTCLFAL